MRIVHIAESIFGGVGSYLDEIGQYQSKRLGSNNVLFVIPNGSATMLPSVARSQIIELRTVGRTPHGLFKLGLAIARIVNDVDPDIVHLHSTFAGFVGRIALSLWPHRSRLVYCPHGWAFGMEVAWHKQAIYARCEKLLAAKADLIIINSYSEQTLALRYGIPADKLRVIKNGAASVPPRFDLPLERAPIHVAFVGRLDRQKGLDILLAELDRPDCDHLHLHVVGKCIASKSSPLVARVLKNVTFYGWMSRAQISALMVNIDAVVMPSRWEAFGLVAIEAMRAGVPVVASSRGGLPEVVQHGVDGLIVDISVPGELGDILAGLDREHLRELGKAAQARFHAEFTAERMNREISATYSSLLTTSGRQTAPMPAGSIGTPAE